MSLVHQGKTLMVARSFSTSTQGVKLTIWSVVILLVLPYTVCHASQTQVVKDSGRRLDLDPDLPFRNNYDYPNEQTHFSNDSSNHDLIRDHCLAFYTDYVEAAANFTNCELLNAQPFRLCRSCIIPHAITTSLFNDLKNKPHLKQCRIKYMLSDRVQIIPTVQRNIDAVWTDADCEGCSSDIHINHTTREVNFTVPKEVELFEELYKNLSACLGIYNNFEQRMFEGVQEQIGNVSKACHNCRDMYNQLNNLYEDVSNDKEGNVCMDLVDMMNYTRLVWSTHLNCTHRSGDSAAVVIITCAVATSPLFFYISLRITGKERRKKIFKQKRLGVSQDMSSVSQSFSAGDGSRGAHRSLTPFT